MISFFKTAFRRVLRHSSWEQDLQEELRFHIEARAADLVKTGLDEAKALRQARLEFGGVEGHKEEIRSVWGIATFFDELTRNLKYSLRSLRNSPVFTAVGVLSLALGIGANVATFHVAERLLLHELPVRDPGGLYQVGTVGSQGFRSSQSYIHYSAIRSYTDLFSTTLAWSSPWELEVKIGERIDRLKLSAVTGTYFPALGLNTPFGRLLTPEDDRKGAEDVAVLSYAAWQRVFNGDAAAVEKSIRIAGVPFRIAGIVPEGFSGVEPGSAAEIFVPIHSYVNFNKNAVTAEGLMWLHTMVRLQPGVPLETARTVFGERSIEAGKDTRKKLGRLDKPKPPTLHPGGKGYSEVRNEFSTPLLVLMALVSIVLLIACANLATLLFVRGALRSGEMSLRLALGASSAQLVRQWMTECMLVAISGGVTGVFLAQWIVEVLMLFVGEESRNALRFHATGPVILFAVAETILTGILFGLGPALRASRVDPGPALKQSQGRRAGAWKWVLSAQIAASLVLVTGAVLFSRTMWNLSKESGGFARDEVVWGMYKYNREHPATRADLDKAVEQLRNSPWFAAVGLGRLPTYGNGGWNWATVPGYVPGPNEDNIIYFADATPGYFEVMKIGLLQGRDFEAKDAVWPPQSIVVSESFVRHYFGTRSALGVKVGVYRNSPPAEIVGVVKDVKYSGLRETKRDVVYSAVAPQRLSTLVARVKRPEDQNAALAELRAAMKGASRDTAIESGTMNEIVERSIRRDLLVGRLSAAFGVLGVIIAAIGLYGTMANEVASRTREIGLRIALGANSWKLVRSTGASVGGVILLGFLVGVPISLAGAYAIRSMFYEVSPVDPVAFSASVLILAFSAVLAAAIPIRRAIRMDPLQSLRHE